MFLEITMALIVVGTHYCPPAGVAVRADHEGDNQAGPSGSDTLRQCELPAAGKSMEPQMTEGTQDPSSMVTPRPAPVGADRPVIRAGDAILAGIGPMRVEVSDDQGH